MGMAMGTIDPPWSSGTVPEDDDELSSLLDDIIPQGCNYSILTENNLSSRARTLILDLEDV
jgi:hypothetical protein